MAQTCRKINAFSADSHKFYNHCRSLRTEYAAHTRKKRKAASLPLTFPALVSLGGQDLTAIVGTASLARSVGLGGLTTLGANGHAGSGQLTVAATALIATGLGHFTLRDSHG